MKMMYASKDGAGPTYEIETDRHGSYTIRLEGRVIRRVTAVTNYFGKPKWGSRKLEQDALEDAKAAIESFRDSEIR